jgi:hypothetical protein
VKNLLALRNAIKWKFQTCDRAFGRQTPTIPAVHRRWKLKGWASTWMSHDGFHEKIGSETPVFGRGSYGGFWPEKVKNALPFNGD